MISQIEVRLRYPGEEIPAELMTGLEAFAIVEDWQWLVIHENKIVAQVLTAPAHGLLIFLRMMSLAEAPPLWMLLALRRILADARERGLFGYVALLEDFRPSEAKLMRLAQRSTGMLRAFSGAIAFGSTEVKY